MISVPIKYKAKDKVEQRAGKAKGKTVKPSKGMTSGKVLTPSEAMAEQQKKKKKATKGSSGYSGVNRT